MSPQRLMILMTAALILLVAGCGDSGKPVGPSGVASNEWLAIDLITGEARPLNQAPDLNASVWRTTQVLVLAVRGPLLRVAADPWAKAGESPVLAPGPSYFIAVFELTQQQWQLLGGGTPWRSLASAGLVGTEEEPEAPAYGLSRIEVDRVLAAARVRGQFSLPSASQWEYACRAGSSARFGWGDNPTPQVAGVYAHTWETGNAVKGPRRVGSLAANAFGLHDMHGNVAELVQDGTLRGGSWSDSVAGVRAGLRQAIDPATPHALAGLRVIYVPVASKNPISPRGFRD